MSSLKGLNLGYALCGSFCTFSKSIATIQQLVDLGVNVFPIMTENAYTTDTRFGDAKDIINKIETITGKKIIHTIEAAEPLGPKDIVDAIVIAPCTGNSLGKLNNAICNTAPLLGAKSLMRNGKPVVICLCTNDGLGTSLKNLGGMFRKKGVFFVPFGQDNPQKKPYSLVGDFSQVVATLELALEGKQIQPMFVKY